MKGWGSFEIRNLGIASEHLSQTKISSWVIVDQTNGNLCAESDFVMVTDAVDGVYVAEEEERHILLTMMAGQGDRNIRLFFSCSNDCCE